MLAPMSNGGNNGRVAPDPEGGRSDIRTAVVSKLQRRISLKRWSNSRPPWGAGSGANRIAGDPGNECPDIARFGFG
ncbi:hypothetical protein GCM10011315_20660 [Roseovarius pacificus]|nr:hypothetical protein GCM10011315_20660 [Roseovarius pacificus]